MASVLNARTRKVGKIGGRGSLTDSQFSILVWVDGHLTQSKNGGQEVAVQRSLYTLRNTQAT